MRVDIQAPDAGKHSMQEAGIAKGRPPKTRSHALKSIIGSGKTLIVAPLIAGCYQSSTLIATGQYLAAIKCAGAAGLAFLLLAVFLELADAFVGLVWKRQTVDKMDSEKS